jgi:peptide deformylase
MEIVYAPNPILEKELQDVDLENLPFDPLRLKKDMSVAMLNNYGVGLSACQVGLDYKVFVMGDKPDNITLHINPTVLQYTEETVLEMEGCLSFPNVYVKVKRPKEILAEYYDEFLKKQTVKITGYSARVYLHELDHCLGITFKDRVSKLKWDMAKKKATKLEKQHA